MTKQSKITATVESIPFANLYLSEINPRSVVSETGIEALAQNIAKVGLVQNLAGLRDATGDKVGIVAGGRRLRALALLQNDPRFQTVTVQVTEDAEIARLWATSENSQRAALHPADEIRDYGAMAERKIAIADIAVAYGVTEKHVYRRLALAGLPAPVLDALKSDEISLGQAAAFTIGTDEAVILETLEKHRADVERGWGGLSEYQIKTMLKPDSVKGSDRRATFVGVEDYKAAGGRIGGDLFEDETLFDDPEILDEVFQQKLDAAAAHVVETKGWKWAEAITESYVPWDFMERGKFGRLYPVEGTLTEDEAERYDELADLANGEVLDEDGQAELDALEAKIEGDFTDEQKAHAGVIVLIDRDGQIAVQAGLVRKEDRKAAEDAGILEPSRHKVEDDAPKSPISDKLRSDLRRVETGARQNALLDDPKLALHLLAFQLAGKTGYGRAYGIRTDDVPNMPDTETGYTLDKRLTTPERDTGDRWNRDLAKDFTTFRRRGDKKIMDLLHRYLVSQLSIGDEGLGELIDKAVSRDTRSVWTPTAENFFSRVGGPYLNDLWCDLLDLKADHPTATTFAKLKKGEKAEKLEKLFNDPDTRAALGVTETQEARIAAWLPEGMK
jgi:ParB family chromosome partitioning protein